nr:RNA-directed DNA polymerase, eukaryota [Tanacetum cinerariifolium]
MQKAKIRWAIEGDENSKYFHAIINKKRANLFVKGVMVDGDWIDDPHLVKQEFQSHLANRFQDPGSRRGSLKFLFPNRLSNDQILELESSISKDEIRTAVWGCGVDKSPGQTVLLLNSFASTGPLLDLILALEWNARCKLKKKQATIFKVDFAKAYDSIRWDFLDDVLISFGFRSKWRSWISGSLSSGKASILVNESPTPEFHFHRGLKQGDPLAPFLFLLIMESLHLSFSWAVEAKIFT